MEMNTLNQIADAVHKNAVEHGFHPKRQSKDRFIEVQLNNLHSEVSELWDAYRGGKWYDICDKGAKMAALGLRPLSCAEEEYADIVIRALDQCRALHIDIHEAIRIKHAYNITRPYKHKGSNA